MKRTLFLLSILLAIPQLATSQQQVSLTVDEAIRVAIENNRQLEISRLTIANADAQVKEAFGNALPTVDLNTRYTYNIQKPSFFLGGADGTTQRISVGGNNALTADLSVSQVIFNSAVFTGVGTAETYAKISRQQLRTEASQTVLNVRRAYYTAQFAAEVLRVNEALLTNADSNFKYAQTLYKAGLRGEFDAIRADVQAANQRPVVIQARDNFQAAKDNLALLLGYDSDVEIILVDPIVVPVAETRVEPQLAEARALMEQNNSQLKTLQLNSEVNRDLIKIKESDYLPTVALFGTYRMEAQADKLGDLDFQPTSFVGLNLSLNLFKGYKTDAQAEQARVLYEQSKYQLSQAGHALNTQLEILLRKIDYARQRIKVGERTIAQAEKGYRIASVAYKAGTGTQLQINDADLALAQARLNQLSATYDYNVALAELEQLLGERFSISADNKDVKYSSK